MSFSFFALHLVELERKLQGMIFILLDRIMKRSQLIIIEIVDPLSSVEITQSKSQGMCFLICFDLLIAFFLRE